MKITVMLEITPQMKVAILWRPCSRCDLLIGPFFAFEAHRIADVTLCKTCTSTLETAAKNTTVSYLY
jgi:hypothetical protein